MIGTILVAVTLASAAAPAAAARAVRRRQVVSLEQLRAIMPKAPAAKAALCLPLLNAAMIEAFDGQAINTPRRAAAFVAQLALESGELRWFEELATGDAYEGRLNLGNTQPGDGRRYKGRGPIQLTGRANYRTCGKALGLPLEEKPELAAEPAVGFRIAAWYWHSRNLNRYADTGEFDRTTYLINGGYNGREERLAYYEVALKVLGVSRVG